MKMTSNRLEDSFTLMKHGSDAYTDGQHACLLKLNLGSVTWNVWR